MAILTRYFSSYPYQANKVIKQDDYRQIVIEAGRVNSCRRVASRRSASMAANQLSVGQRLRLRHYQRHILEIMRTCAD